MIRHKGILILNLAILLAGCTAYAPQPSESTAIVSLINQAAQYRSSGDFAAASTSLERALRIEPRNPQLWYQLAQVRIDQQQYRQAENLAQKSNTLSQNNPRLRRLNWLLISRARSLSGDQQGAENALRKASID
jgi:Tfp pilus assembly protein PilF